MSTLCRSVLVSVDVSVTCPSYVSHVHLTCHPCVCHMFVMCLPHVSFTVPSKPWRDISHVSIMCPYWCPSQCPFLLPPCSFTCWVSCLLTIDTCLLPRTGSQPSTQGHQIQTRVYDQGSRWGPIDPKLTLLERPLTCALSAVGLPTQTTTHLASCIAHHRTWQLNLKQDLF